MTTPERLRRRQTTQGIVLILLAVASALQALIFALSDRDQQRCFQERFTELSAAAEIRGELAEKETRLTRRVLRTYARAARLLEDDPSRSLTPAEQADLQTRMVQVLIAYDVGTLEIQRDRRDNPIPPFPLGTCEGK